MAAKKKSSKKKAAKKKVSPKPKKAAKKKAVKKAVKKATRAPKARAVKKVAKKKAAPKKKRAIRVVPKGPSIAFAEPPGPPLTMTVRFLLGQGEVEVTHLRGEEIIEVRDIQVSNVETFSDVKKLDRLALSVTCTGTAEITTDRLTKPLSNEQNPLKFSDGTFIDGLSVRS